MAGEIRLTKSELAALDLVIQSLGQAGPGGFIGDIFNAINRVIQVAQQVTPVVTFVTQAIGGVGAQSSLQQQIRDAIGPLPPGVSLDTLIELRKRATAQ